MFIFPRRVLKVPVSYQVQRLAGRADSPEKAEAWKRHPGAPKSGWKPLLRLFVVLAAFSAAMAQEPPPAPAASSFTPAPLTPQVAPEPKVSRANPVRPMPRVSAMPTPAPAAAEPKKNDEYPASKTETAVAQRTGWFDGRPTETITLRAAIEQA